LAPLAASLPTRTSALPALGSTQSLGEIFQLLFQAIEFFPGQTVGQSKGDGLQQVLGIPVRQVSTRIPCFGRLAFGRNANVLVGWFSFFQILHGF
jgi:hypothetical protein